MNIKIHRSLHAYKWHVSNLFYAAINFEHLLLYPEFIRVKKHNDANMFLDWIK